MRDLDLLAQARAHCDVLTVGVLRDDDLIAGTGRVPVIGVEERLVLASHLRGVDRAVIHDPDEYARLGDSVVVMAVRGESDWLRPDPDLVLTPHVESQSRALRTVTGPGA
ncbi:hypothetical protein GC722_04230 [Auraticoccus sp. F435]|uniref:Uncharacterized protein n=1 Tax=Auraticoccus cholistanensis TaxID=2656650 RepID=A0A6A9V0A1_9ACTN|nr:hypothetical protein [Auraticoccus cholistanensis]MVA75239.1 hypothetical protein [Auraticoccus cholistanensis]